MTPLRVLYIDAETVWRGGQEQLFTLMTGLRREGHRIDLAAPPEGALGKRAAERGFPVHPYRQRFEWSPRAFFRLRRILSRARFDVVHDNTPRSIIGAALAARLEGVPVHVSSRRVVFPLRSPLSRFKYNWCQDSVLCVCGAVRDVLVAGGVKDDKVEVVYEGVEPSLFDGPSPPMERCGPDQVWVGISAALTPEKGHADLLEAMTMLARDDDKVRLLVLGAGPLEAALRRRAADCGLAERVRFEGFRSDADAFVRNVDIFCLPSRSEGFSSAVLAAMANRLPVVATRVGGNPELVEDGVTGLLCPSGAPAALAAALRRLVDSPAERERMGAAGRQRIESSFSMSRKIARTEQVYRKLLESRRFG